MVGVKRLIQEARNVEAPLSPTDCTALQSKLLVPSPNDDVSEANNALDQSNNHAATGNSANGNESNSTDVSQSVNSNPTEGGAMEELGANMPESNPPAKSEESTCDNVDTSTCNSDST